MYAIFLYCFFKQYKKNNIRKQYKNFIINYYSTVTTFAKFLGLSGFMPFSIEIM